MGVTTYEEAIDWLFSTQMFGVKLGLEPVEFLLRETLAYPDARVKVIHVAGTNGKGSTCAMIDHIARSCGIKSGLFTSPHLVDFRERVQVSGVQIPENETLRLLNQLRLIAERMAHHPTFFELSLVLAMRWFKECECELIVLETGMGGRLDATTAVPADVAVITPIGLDHTEWLGDSLTAIAHEKAGIFVANKPAISAPQHPEAAAEIQREANRLRVPLEVIHQPLLGYAIALKGEHQRWNAALAVAALHRIEVTLRQENIRYGLARVNWPGRFEKLDDTIVLDGAHNPQAAQSLADTWRAEYGDEKVSLIFSAATGKDVAGVLAILAPLAAVIHLCPVQGSREVSPATLALELPCGAPPHEIHEQFPSALAAAKRLPHRILIAGSLFLVGAAKAHFQGAAQQISAQ